MDCRSRRAGRSKNKSVTFFGTLLWVSQRPLRFFSARVSFSRGAGDAREERLPTPFSAILFFSLFVVLASASIPPAAASGRAYVLVGPFGHGTGSCAGADDWESFFWTTPHGTPEEAILARTTNYRTQLAFCGVTPENYSLRVCGIGGFPSKIGTAPTAADVVYTPTINTDQYNCGTGFFHFTVLGITPSCPAGTEWVGPRLQDCAPPNSPPNKNNGSCGGSPDAASGNRGNPCNAATGNKFETEPDATGGLPFTRYYNSQYTADIGFGFGWTSSLSSRKLSINASTVQILRADGKGEVFTCSTSACLGDADTHLTLSKDASGYTLAVNPSGVTERYDTTGKLQTETDAAGRTTRYGYDASGRVSTVTGPFGHVAVLGYGTNNHVTLVTNAANQTIGYVYDSNNNLARVNYPDGTAKRYHYENAGFPHHLTGISFVEANGTVTRYGTYGYEANGKATLSEHAGGMERFGFTYNSETQTTVTDAGNTTEVLTFQTTLGLKSLVSRANQADNKSLTQTFDAHNNLTCKQDEEGRVTTYTYNTTNQKLSETQGLSGTCSAPQSTAATRTTTYQYLAPTLDLPTVIESPSVYAGSLKRTEIAYQGHLPTTITQRGHTPTGNPVARTVTMQYNSQGQVTHIDGPRTDVNDITQLTYYDCTTGGACGQLASITNALGHTTTFDTYDPNGRLLQTTDANALRTSYQYDARGRVRFITQTPPSGTARTTEYRYNAAGDVTFTAFPDGRTLTYTYSPARKLTRVTDNQGNYVAYGYDQKGNRTSEQTYGADNTLVRQLGLAYDARNRLSALNAAGSLTQQVHDAVGNLTQTIDPKANPATTHHYDALNRLLASVDALGATTGYHYDANDRLKHVTAPNSATTQYAYDDLGNLLSETSPDRGTTTYTYDAAGNLRSHTDARGITATYTYDALNRVTAIGYPNPAENVAFVYDTGETCSAGIGRLCRVQDESGATAYGYDAFGNVLTQTKQELSRTYTTGYTYDAADRIMRITYPDNRVVTYTRDALGRIASVSTTVNANAQTIVATRSYRADGLLTGQTFGNGLTETRQYNLKGELTHQFIGAADTRVYDYDLNGNLTRKQSLPEEASYTFDALDRLTAESASDASHNAFTYDANGNRTSDLNANGNPRTYAYAPGTNRLTQVGNQAITTDVAGYTLSDRNGNRTYTWDGAGRLRTVTRQGTLRGTYVYNYLHQRTQKTRLNANGTTARFVYHYDLAGNLIAETRPNGNLVRLYVWADNEPIAQLQNRPALQTEELIYLHTDHLATPRLATDATQTVVWRNESEAFGTGKPETDPDGDETKTNVRLRMAGQYVDGESWLFYNWNRYYDPRIGRYLQFDRVGIIPGAQPPESILPMYSVARWTNDLLMRGLNQPYAYANNNPLRFIDPFGLTPEDGSDSSSGDDYSRYRICPNKFIVENICQACIDLACKISGTVCCTIEQNACYAAAPGDEKKAAECRNKFIQCLGGYRGKPKLPKGPGDGEI
jgi:RHS repeat-associated protein